MVRDGLIYYNFSQQKWEANTAVLAANTDFNAEEFAAKCVCPIPIARYIATDVCFCDSIPACSIVSVRRLVLCCVI
jgi:hypothetical protein